MTKINFMILFLLLLIFGVYWKFFLPGPRVAIDFPSVSDNQLKSMIDLPRVWSEGGAEGLGEYSVHTLWSWPVTFLSGSFANLGFSFTQTEKFLIMIPFLILGIWGMWKLGEDLKLSSPANFIATLFYMTNTYILLVLDGGQLTIGLAYVFLPISFLAIKNSIYGRFKDKILAGLSIWVLGSFDFRFIYILIFLCLIYFVYELLFIKGEGSHWVGSWFKTGLICGLIVIALNAYWISPLIKAPLSSNTYSNLIQTNFISFTSLGHAMFVLAPHWFKNIFGVITPLRFEFIFITILVFLAPILRPKDKAVGFWLLVAIISIFLSKGTSDPFGEVYKWFYLHIPGFSLFRDSTKFFFLVGLSYAVLIGITTDEILRKLSKIAKLKFIFLIITTIYFLVIISPSWQSMMTGTLSPQPFEKEYFNLNKFLENDEKFFRIFWIPSIPPLGQIDRNHPSVEAARLVQKRAFAQGTLGTYEIFNFLREASYMGEIFDVSGIGYIAYPYLDPRRDDPTNAEYYYIFLDQLSKRPWLSRVDSSIPLLKVNQHQDRFFLIPNVWWVIGSDNLYKEATKSARLKLSKNALIFVENQAGLGRRVNEVPQVKIVLNGKTITDLAASFIDTSDLIFPASKLDFEPNKSRWWKREAKDLIRWRDFLQTKYGIDNQDFDLGGGWAVGENNLKLQIENLKLKEGQILLARVMESSRSGKIKFHQDNQLVGELITKTEKDTNIRWFEVGEMIGERDLLIESDGDINVVNALSVIDRSEWVNHINRAKELQGRILSFNEEDTFPDDNTKITYQQINPTKYKVSIKNLTHPRFIVFSQSYDGLWKMNDQSSLPVYSLLNGFRVEKDGEYDVYFDPQKYVLPGLMISSISLIFILLFLFPHSKVRE